MTGIYGEKQKGQSMSRLASKKVFILGAGASIGHSENSFPSINGFFRSAKRLGYDNGEDFTEIADFLNNAWGKDIRARKDPIDIEELYTHIEIELERRPSPKLLKIRQHLFNLIVHVLWKLEKSIEHQQGEYDEFLKLNNNVDSIITFNWDLLLDNKLGREKAIENAKSVPTGNRYPQYDNFIKNLSAYSEWTWAHLSIPKPYHSWKPDTGYYLKLHGSIDWFYCNNESCRAHNKVFPQTDPNICVSCSLCHEPLDLLLIPPALNKGYRQYPLIRLLWNLAAQEIRSATEIVIWGYSLPATDFYSTWLLRQAREASIGRLTIIDPQVIIKDSKNIRKPFIDRFSKIFSDKLPVGSPMLFESFSDFASGNSVDKKYGQREIKNGRQKVY